MRTWITCGIAVVCMALLTGCATVTSPAVGWVYTDVQWGGHPTGNAGSSKVGRAKATSYLGVIATGDASVEAAARSAGITKIHHVDYYSKHILVVGWLETVVYGE